MTDNTTTEVLRKSIMLLEEEHNNGELSDEEFAASKAKYLSLGVELLEDDVEAPKRDDIRVVGVSKKQRDSAVTRRAAVWTVAIFVVIGITSAVLLHNKSARQTGASATGNVAQSSEDVLSQANSAQSQGDLATALPLYDQVLKTQPNNLDALSSRGWTLYLASTAIPSSDASQANTLIDQSLQSLDKAVEINPEYGPARAWRGVVLLRAKADYAGAIKDFDAYLANSDNDALRTLVQSARDIAVKAQTK